MFINKYYLVCKDVIRFFVFLVENKHTKKTTCLFFYKLLLVYVYSALNDFETNLRREIKHLSYKVCFMTLGLVVSCEVLSTVLKIIFFCPLSQYDGRRVTQQTSIPGTWWVRIAFNVEWSLCVNMSFPTNYPDYSAWVSFLKLFPSAFCLVLLLSLKGVINVD